jgi:acetolactate synthase-1/2/3 large subunit
MIKVSEYIVNFLNKNGINTLFTITGGFAMHLNDSFGNNKNYNIYYQHHEQACGYSAVGYTKTSNKPSIVCTTAGCAATNAISPCLVAYQDSLPVLFISGQVKSNESIRTINNKKMKLRHYAGADCDIISAVESITKYAHEITNVDEIESVLIKTIKNLINGRPGPVWLSIPVDIQGMFIPIFNIPIIEKDIFNPPHNPLDTSTHLELCTELNISKIYNLLLNSKRPLIIAGNGIKLAGCNKKFRDFISCYNIPVVTTFLGTDLIESDNKLYCGKIGLIGDRTGNFTLQNCDLLLSLGCRMSQGIVGYRSDWFAREAKIIYIDNDSNELEKTNITYCLKINMDLNVFFDNFNNNLNKRLVSYDEWINTCNRWKTKWNYELPLDIMKDDLLINPYNFLKQFYIKAPENKITLASSGSIVTVAWHMCFIKKGDKFIISTQGDMGFELPASIGAIIAEKDKMCIPILGEGSFQLNIQELQTIVQYNLPVKILLFNNGAYGAIQITQTNFFKNKYGVDTSSGISFPNSENIAKAYGIKYISVKDNNSIDISIDDFLSYKGPIILEVFCCIQGRTPRLNAIKNEDGTFTNRPFEDMDPFMSREEFNNEMIVKIV